MLCLSNMDTRAYIVDFYLKSKSKQEQKLNIQVQAITKHDSTFNFHF